MTIIEIKDIDIVKTDSFALGKFPFTHFNPVQSAILPIVDKPANCLVSANTASGKTAIAEMFILNEVIVNKGKGIYLSPLKALSQEKLDDWRSPGHHFSDFKIAICTGDYQITPDRKKELEQADIIIMTYEILNSISRSRSDKCNFLKENITIIIDEAHLIGGDSSRSSHVEVGLLNFININPNARIVALSATMPNYKEIGEWLSLINDKDTYILKSDYRPCVLKKNYEIYNDKGRYYDKEERKVKKAISIVKKYDQDKFIIFAHGKKTGHMMLESLLSEGIQADYHNADLAKDERIKLENEFRENKSLRVLVATSTLSAGINAPARRVITLGVHRGLSEVGVNDIIQSAGRAGRPKYDKEGDVHFILPQSKLDDWKYRINNPPDILSALIPDGGDFKALAFHIVSLIHHGVINNREELHVWFSKTLAHYQNKKLDDGFIDEMLNSLKLKNILKEEDGYYVLTLLGKISSMFYYSPYDISDLCSNFGKLFNNKNEEDDFYLSMSLSNIDTCRFGIASSAEIEETESYQQILSKKRIDYNKNNMSVVKIGFSYYSLLNGKDNIVLANVMRGLQYDFGRTLEVIRAIDSMVGKWYKDHYWDGLAMRISYGIKWEMVEICGLSGIGKVKGNKLWNAGIRSLKDVVSSSDKIKLTLKCSDETASNIVKEAKEMLLV